MANKPKTAKVIVLKSFSLGNAEFVYPSKDKDKPTVVELDNAIAHMVVNAGKAAFA